MEMQMEINAAEAGLDTGFESRLAAVEERLAAIEARLEELAAPGVSAAAHVTKTVTHSRRTLPTAMTSLLAKQGVSLDPALASIEAGALDQALTPLSIEQRIAVKAQLFRTGLLS